MLFETAESSVPPGCSVVVSSRVMGTIVPLS
jgi:hypothetical protein